MGPAAGVDDEAKGSELGRKPEPQPPDTVRTVTKAADNEAMWIGSRRPTFDRLSVGRLTPADGTTVGARFFDFGQTAQRIGTDNDGLAPARPLVPAMSRYPLTRAKPTRVCGRSYSWALADPIRSSDGPRLARWTGGRQHSSTSTN